MALERYTDGSDGSGIRDFNELLRYFQREPHSFYYRPFCTSYGFLMTTPEREAQLLAVYDCNGSSAETLRYVKDMSLRSRLTAPAVVTNRLVRYRLRRDFYMQRNPRGNLGNPARYEQFAHMVLVMHDAAEAGQAFFLCESCTAAESAGFATDPLCEHDALMLIEESSGWESPSNTLQVCCAEAQCLRGRKADTSEHLTRKLASLRAAWRASPEERRHIRARGNGCAAAGCSRREPYAGAFKTCSRCRSAHYCSVLCQARALIACLAGRSSCQNCVTDRTTRRRRTGRSTRPPAATRPAADAVCRATTDGEATTKRLTTRARRA